MARSATAASPSRTEAGVPDYEAALASNTVTLDLVLDARWRLNALSRHDGAGHPTEDDRLRWAYADYLPRLWRSYEKSVGTIVESYLPRHFLAGVVLTVRNQLHLRYPPEAVAGLTPAFEETLWSCSAQFREARQVLLPGGGRRILLVQLYSLLVYLLSVLDSQAARRPSDPASVAAADRDGQAQVEDRIAAALDVADRQLRRTRRDLDAFAQRDGQQVYLLGMAPGIGLLLLVSFLTARVQISGVEVQPLLVALAAGGIGAVVSVMTRIMRPTMRFDYHAGNTLTVVAGLFRPVIGGIFGLAVYVLLNAGLVQVAKVPDDGNVRTYFFMGLAFLAGFSERWAQDILLLAGHHGREDADGDSEPTPVSPSPTPGRG